MQSNVDFPHLHETQASTLLVHAYANNMAVMAALIFSRQLPHYLNHDLVSAK